MKSYSKFESIVPQGVQVIIEGRVIRLFFDFYRNKVEIDNEINDQLVCENVDVIGRTYGDIVNAIIIDRYSTDKREAILANYDEVNGEGCTLSERKRIEYLNEYTDFQKWRKHAKEIATEALTKL